VLYLGNLNAKRDWGHAKDYVEAMYLMLQCKTPGDYVVATGEQHTVREFCEAAFKEVGFALSWSGVGVEEVGVDVASGKIIVRLDKKYFRPTEVDSLRGDASKIRKELGWKPKVGFVELVKEMVEHDLKEAMREVHLKSGGFRTSNNHYEK
jgi:GDPmannose 4,6-dehydratase